MTPAQVLADDQARLTALRSELAAAPNHKRGSLWWSDRAEEIRAMEASIARREALTPEGK